MDSSMNLLDYVKSVSKVDFDSQDLELVKVLGPFVDCTSNQIDSYLELAEHRRSSLLRKCVGIARVWKEEFPNVTVEELAGEISMCAVSLTMLPYITGHILVMANPTYANESLKLVENSQRIAKICQRLEPSFDQSRLCIKMVATWEGFQACRKLKQLGIKTLATTLFTLEQAILAAEAGCIYISPFVHSLGAVLNDQYDEPMVDVCVSAQKYYQQHSYATEVKAAAVMSVDEVKEMCGVASMTLPAWLLKDLAAARIDQGIERASLFNAKDGVNADQLDRVNFLNDEEKYREAFGRSLGGKGKALTEQAIEIFSEYQIKLEKLMQETAAMDM